MTASALAAAAEVVGVVAPGVVAPGVVAPPLFLLAKLADLREEELGVRPPRDPRGADTADGLGRESAGVPAVLCPRRAGLGECPSWEEARLSRRSAAESFTSASRVLSPSYGDSARGVADAEGAGGSGGWARIVGVLG